MEVAVTDIRDPRWRPGRGTLQKAHYRARQKGVPFEQALDEVVQIARDRLALNELHIARSNAEVSGQRAANRAEKDNVFPAPQSIHAVPTAIETQRRGH